MSERTKTILIVAGLVVFVLLGVRITDHQAPDWNRGYAEAGIDAQMAADWYSLSPAVTCALLASDLSTVDDWPYQIERELVLASIEWRARGLGCELP